MSRKGFCCLLICCFCFGLTGCEQAFTKMEGTEYGVIFSAFPRTLGGGIRDKVLRPGDMAFILPWETVYRIDAGVQNVGWGDADDQPGSDAADYVQTRTLDGNEVGLSFSIQYRIDPEKIAYIVQNVSVNDKGIRRLVEALSRADIRTHMNMLRTLDYFDNEQMTLVAEQSRKSLERRLQTAERVKKSLNHRLNREGIIIEDVGYKGHRFERRLPDGKIDQSYQDLIDNTQAVIQETEQEIKKVNSELERKRREKNDALAKVNSVVQEAEGYKHQAKLRGDGYLKAKENEAEQIRSVGEAEVEGLRKQIEAMNGPGGEALLRLSVVRELLANKPSFVVLNGSQDGKGGFDIHRLDTNELLKQIGAFAGEIGQDVKPKSETETNQTQINQTRATEAGKSALETPTGNVPQGNIQ